MPFPEQTMMSGLIHSLVIAIRMILLVLRQPAEVSPSQPGCRMAGPRLQRPGESSTLSLGLLINIDP